MYTFVQAGSQRFFIGSFLCHILLLQKLKMCNVVVLIEIIRNCYNYRILKMYEDIFEYMYILSRRFVKDCSSDHFQILYTASTDIEDVHVVGLTHCVLLSRLFLKDFSSDHFYFIYCFYRN